MAWFFFSGPSLRERSKELNRIPKNNHDIRRFDWIEGDDFWGIPSIKLLMMMENHHV